MGRCSFAWTVSFGSALAASALVTSISACTADDGIGGPRDCDGSSCEGRSPDGSGPGTDAAVADRGDGASSSTDGSGPETDAAVADPGDATSTADASVLDGSSADASRALDDLEALFQANFTPITNASSFAEPTSAAYHCLAASSAYRRATQGAAFDPIFRANLALAAKAAADSLAASAPTWGGAGWGLPTSWDAFGDGTTNPASTVYAFQTGLAAWCLAEAGSALGDAAYASLAKSAITAYRASGYVDYGQGYAIDCTSCGYFWYSLAGADVGRYVKNTNIEMAVASFALDRYFPDAAARASALAATSSQYAEIVSYANYGYLGRYDPAYSAGAAQFDDHNSFEAYLLLRAGELSQQADFTAAALTHYRAYAPQCSPDYVAYAACHFARTDAAAKAACVAWVTAHGATNPAGVGLVMDYR